MIPRKNREPIQRTGAPSGRFETGADERGETRYPNVGVGRLWRCMPERNTRRTSFFLSLHSVECQLLSSRSRVARLSLGGTIQFSVANSANALQVATRLPRNSRFGFFAPHTSP